MARPKQEWVAWLVGLIDGEGCFAIQRWGRGHYCCRFGLKLRADDKAVLEEIVAETGIGTLVPEQRAHHEGAANDCWKWSIQSKADALALVRLIERYPLRTKKARDFAIWRDAVIEWQDVRQRGPIAYAGWSRFEEWRLALIEGRRYQEEVSAA